MPTLNFYLEKRKSENKISRTENLPIMLYFSYDGKRFQYYTGEKTDLKYWDHGRQRLYEIAGSRLINDFLNYLDDEVWALYRRAKASGIRPGNDYFRSALKKSGSRNTHDFYDVFVKFIDEKHKDWSISTFRKVKTLYNHLRTFQVIYGFTAGFEKINNVFLDAFIEYFTEKLGHSNNTCQKNLVILKGFLKWATEKGYNHNDRFMTFKFPWSFGQKYGITPLSLNREELARFMGHRFEEENLQHARDIFCLMCFTGLRYEEVCSLKRRSVTEDWIHPGIIGKKHQRSIPLNKHARQILSLYNCREWGEDRCFTVYSNVTMNRQLKIAAETAGINDPVGSVIFSGNTERRRNIPKWQAMSTRIALNTFIMTAFDTGINEGMVMELTGHRSLAGIRRYESALSEMKKKEIGKFDDLLYPSPLERGR